MPQVRSCAMPLATKLHTLWIGRKLLRQAAALGLMLSFLIAFAMPKKFRSLTSLMPSRQVDSWAMLASWTIQDDLITKFDLKKVYRDRFWEDARLDLQRNTMVSEDRKNGIVTIAVVDTSPQRAAAMGQEYAEEVNRRAIQLTQQLAHQKRLYLRQQVMRVSEELEAAESKLGSYSNASMFIDPQEQIGAAIQGTLTLDKNVTVEQAGLESLRTIYADSNPMVRSAEAEIKELNRQKMEATDSTQPNATTNSENPTLYEVLRKAPELEMDYADLSRTVQIKEQSLETLDAEYRSAQFDETSNVPVVAVLDPPSVPERAFWPPRFWIVCFGTCGSVLLAGFWLVILDARGNEYAKYLFVSLFRSSTATALPPERENQGTPGSGETPVAHDQEDGPAGELAAQASPDETRTVQVQ
jgi:uncharacterized protein involved in exopolysaccharide biosynthesis